MDRIKNIYQSLTEQELKSAVKDIASQHETGFYYYDGVLGTVQNKISAIIGERYSIEAVVHGITWEISRRWYNGFYGVTESSVEE